MRGVGSPDRCNNRLQRLQRRRSDTTDTVITDTDKNTDTGQTTTDMLSGTAAVTTDTRRPGARAQIRHDETQIHAPIAVTTDRQTKLSTAEAVDVE